MIPEKPKQCKALRRALRSAMIELREAIESAVKCSGGWSDELRERYKELTVQTIACVRGYAVDHHYGRIKCREKCAAIRATLWSFSELGMPA